MQDDEKICEFFSVIKRAIILDSEQKNKVREPRHIQYLTALIMLNQANNKGRFA
jgi:hypothetical protein